jgi:hypothetical protein
MSKHHTETQKHGNTDNWLGQAHTSFRDSMVPWFRVELLLAIICNPLDGRFERALLESDVDAIALIK